MNSSWKYGSGFESIVCNSSLIASISVRFFHFRTLQSFCPCCLQETVKGWEVAVPLCRRATFLALGIVCSRTRLFSEGPL